MLIKENMESLIGKKYIVSIYRSNRFKMSKCISKNEKADIINDDDDENNNQNKESLMTCCSTSLERL